MGEGRGATPHKTLNNRGKEFLKFSLKRKSKENESGKKTWLPPITNVRYSEVDDSGVR